MKYYAQFDRFEIEMTLEDACSASHQGRCDEDVEYLLRKPNIARQLDAIDPADIAYELSGYGTWDSFELEDAEQNRARIVWLAAGIIAEDCKSMSWHTT